MKNDQQNRPRDQKVGESSNSYTFEIGYYKDLSSYE